MNCFWIYIFDKIPTGCTRTNRIPRSCELLLNLYLWQDSNRAWSAICMATKLWIAFEFISLTRFQQANEWNCRQRWSCELLLNLYLWQDSNRLIVAQELWCAVVNCFWIYIFDKIPTGVRFLNIYQNRLWIAFEFISLTRFQQDKLAHTKWLGVVNCFWIYIFDKIPTGS